jgi:hypothetical protein
VRASNSSDLASTPKSTDINMTSLTPNTNNLTYKSAVDGLISIVTESVRWLVTSLAYLSSSLLILNVYIELAREVSAAVEQFTLNPEFGGSNPAAPEPGKVL